jgi:cardiolipin synthase C
VLRDEAKRQPPARVTAAESSQGPSDPSGGQHTPLDVIADDFDAFQWRYESTLQASQSLDLQYYYWRPDLTGRMLAHAVLNAADRGVFVRILIDDVNAIGLDASYLALDQHDKIEVRLFNPCRSREGWIRRRAELALKYFTATRRMHNKLWIVDGKAAILGGRNIGDAYFGAGSDLTFDDLDVAISGPATREAVTLFERYWSSSAAIPIRKLHRFRRGNLPKLRRNLVRHAASAEASAYWDRLNAASGVLPPKAYFNPAVSRVIGDPPEKAALSAQSSWIVHDLNRLIQSANEEIILVSPYFIPGGKGLELLCELAQRGVRISVLTNSLAATDVLVVHGAYAKYRPKLLRLGIRIFEKRMQVRRYRRSILGSRQVSLHTKAIVVDRRKVFVGSFNLDPRSASINTEMGVLIEDLGAAGHIAGLLEDDMRIAYEVSLTPSGLVWHSADDGAVSRTEPDTHLGSRALSSLLGLLPIESQL